MKTIFCMFFFLPGILMPHEMRRRNRKLNKDQRKQTYATYTLLEHVNLDPETNLPNPSDEAIQLAKECVDENEK